MVKIADNQERRIFQIFPVLLKLPVSLIEILFFAFVFPAEMFLFPNVGKSALRWLAVGRVEIQKLRVFGNELLKTEKIFAAGIGFVWRLLAEQPAKVNKMLLIDGSFLALNARPLRFEFARCHIRWLQVCAGTLPASICVHRCTKGKSRNFSVPASNVFAAGYQRKCANALFACAILCTSSRLRIAFPCP